MAIAIIVLCTFLFPWLVFVIVMETD